MRASVTTMALAVSALASVASADRKVYTADDLTNVTSNALSEIDAGDKSSWCQGQFNVCRQLCDGVSENECTNESLEYNCECSNGTAPGLQYYSGSMSTSICLEVFNLCNSANSGDSRALSQCEEVRDNDCPPDELLDAGASSDDSDDDDEEEATATESASGSDSTGDASATADSDDSDATGSSDSEESEEEDDDDSLAAPTAAPFVGAAAMAVAMLVYLA